jgi:hypothetical protein
MHGSGSILARWRAWHSARPLPRRAVKTLVMLVAVLLVLYPKVWLIPTWAGRLHDLDSVIDPRDPHLAALEARVRRDLPEPATPAGVRRVVERTVYAAVPYAFDWDVWGVMDYLPTTAEVFAQAREDCDGQAVVAAALLRRMGYRAWLATDLQHMWVVAHDPNTDEALEIMSPGVGEKTIRADERGTRVLFSWAILSNTARGLGYGVAVFPLGRELILVAVLCAVCLQPASSIRRRLAGAALLVAALFLLRAGGAAFGAVGAHPAFVVSGLACVVCGCTLLILRSRPAGAASVVPADVSQ